jgi:hypothetical protein
MAAYAQSRSFLARLIKGALRHRSGEPGFIAFKVTSEVELLTGMIAATILRALHPASHISLVDHGYENYSLGPHIARLKETEALEGVFDTIVGSKDDIDVVVPRLIDLVSKGVGPRGFLTRDDVADVRSPPEPNWVPPPAVPIFSPVPVLQTRLSQRRCYWSRCTFCTQNAKYDNPRAPGKSEIRRSVDRLEALVGAGYRNVIFADEALSPATIRIVAEEILARKLDVRWACRCKLERSFSRELLTLAANAGCYEILFGLETTSDALLHKMGKAVDGLNPDGVASIFRDMKQIGLGVHVNLICGFPGETLAEADATVKFVVETLAGHRNATYRLNRFTLFPDTPIFSEPSLFGIAHIQMRGDMPQHFAFELTEDVAAETAPVLRQFDAYSARLANGLGWDEIASNAAGRAALDLYFSSGHGAIFKSLSINPFEAARAATPANPAQMSS